MCDGSFKRKFNINNFLFLTKVVSVYKGHGSKVVEGYSVQYINPHHIYIKGPPLHSVVSQGEQRLLGSPPTLGYDC